MLKHILRRKVASNRACGAACQTLFNVSACLVMICGIRRLADMQLSEEQVFVSALAVMSLAGILLLLGFVSGAILSAKIDFEQRAV